MHYYWVLDSCVAKNRRKRCFCNKLEVTCRLQKNSISSCLAHLQVAPFFYTFVFCTDLVSSRLNIQSSRARSRAICGWPSIKRLASWPLLNSVEEHTAPSLLASHADVLKLVTRSSPRTRSPTNTFVGRTKAWRALRPSAWEATSLCNNLVPRVSHLTTPWRGALRGR